jgi:hypothetical protein
MTAQRADINVLDGLAVGGMVAVHTASSLSAAEIGPVGGTVARGEEKNTEAKNKSSLLLDVAKAPEEEKIQ